MPEKVSATTVKTITDMKDSINDLLTPCVSLEEAAQTYTNFLFEKRIEQEQPVEKISTLLEDLNENIEKVVKIRNKIERGVSMKVLDHYSQRLRTIQRIVTKDCYVYLSL